MGWMFWIQYVPILIFLVLGFCIGTLTERAHLRRLATREAALRDMHLTDLRTPPTGAKVKSLGLVVGEAVIASDYFKTFAAALRKIVGGELHTFESLMLRSRREALLRMMESARDMGANGVINVRYSSSNIGSMRRRNAAAMVEMYAYGTAICVSEQDRG